MAISYIDGRTRYGEVRYFLSDRCRVSQGMREFNQGKIRAEELVTFDCALMQMQEIGREEIPKKIPEGQQVLAVLIRPDAEPDARLEREGIFVFCGYDLVEEMSCISAVTNCGARFSQAIAYEHLNEVGLFPSYKEAVLSQIALRERYPRESHACCEVVEIWRLI